MVKRKMLAVDEELAKQVAEIAKEKGQTLFSFTNEILEQAVQAHNMGLTLKRIVDEQGVVKVLRESGFVLAVKTLWFDVLDRAFKRGAKRSLLKKWRETGRWYGKFFVAKKSENPIEGFRDAVCNLMWGASEFDIEVNNGEGEVRCISADFPLSYTELFSAFLGGALEALGYRCTEKDVSKGVIRIRFKVEGEGE